MTNGKETEGTIKTVWATIGAPKQLQRWNNPRAVRTHEGLRSKGVDKEVQCKGKDKWLSDSVKLVAGPLRGHAANQRRIRYFGFEAAYE